MSLLECCPGVTACADMMRVYSYLVSKVLQPTNLLLYLASIELREITLIDVYDIES